LNTNDLFFQTDFPPDISLHGGNVEAECKACGVDPAEVTDFSACLNPLGPPPSLDELLAQGVKLVSSYPDVRGSKAIAALAAAHGVGSDTLLLGNGATELLYLAVRHLHPERTLVLGPAYSDLIRASVLAGSKVHAELASPAKLFHYDLAEIHDTGNYHLVIFSNPCNPTGASIRPAEIMEWAASNPETYFLIDEAFIDFVDRPRASLVGINYKNIIVLKSFTKFFCVAGLRLGMLWGDAELIGVLGARQEPWSVNSIAQHLAPLLYGEKGYIEATHALIRRERSFLVRSLTELGFRVFDSPANFLLLRIEADNISAPELKRMLLMKKILVRDCSNICGLGERFIRVAVRRRDENERLVQAIEDCGYNR